MAQPQQHSQLPLQYRQALIEQQQRQQQEQQRQQQAPQTTASQAPTLEQIEKQYSQLPPQYRQAVLEKQQREQQIQMLQQQQQKLHGQPQQQLQQHQQQQQQPQQAPQPQPPRQTLASDSRKQQSASLASSPAKSATSNRTRVASAPLTSTYRPAALARDSDSVSTYSVNSGPGRAHWKPDSSTLVCTWPGCRREFGFFDRRHHCRKCGDIFCSAHCSKEVPLDQALDFNPSDGIMSRACVGCYEAYEQWQGVIPSPEYDQTYLHSAFRESHEPSHPSALTTAATESSSSSSHSGSNSKKNTGQLPDGYLGNDEQFKAETSNIAIKRRPSKDQTMMPMPSVPHDWSWSTF